METVEFKKQLAEQIHAKVAELNKLTRQAKTAGLSVGYNCDSGENYRRDDNLRVMIIETIGY